MAHEMAMAVYATGGIIVLHPHGYDTGYRLIVERFMNGPLKRGDRVRIREGYVDAGDVGYYDCKSAALGGIAIIEIPADFANNIPLSTRHLLAEAIEPYPYTREERIMRAIEDYSGLVDIQMGREGMLALELEVALFAILDAGV